MGFQGFAALLRGAPVQIGLMREVLQAVGVPVFGQGLVDGLQRIGQHGGVVGDCADPVALRITQDRV